MESNITIESLKDQIAAHELKLKTNEAGKVTSLEVTGDKITSDNYSKLIEALREKGFLADDFVATPPAQAEVQNLDDPREVARKLAEQPQPTES